MGLDQYLSAKRSLVNREPLKEGVVSKVFNPDTFSKVLQAVGTVPVSEDSPLLSIEVNVAYWRKQNAIHDWFVQNVQDGEDNCALYYVDREQLRELANTCAKVMHDNQLAEELLPTSSGFFFGATDYDEWYYKGLHYTFTTINELLRNEELKDWDFYYQSSW